MKLKWIITIIILLVLALGISFISARQTGEEVKQPLETYKIVTTFYPIYGMVDNLIQGAQNVELTNMTQTNIGCLHDYTLGTNDMRKIEDADVLIQNGLGLESFMDKITATYPNLPIIDSSSQVTNLLQEGEGKNPHIWTSIKNYQQQLKTICEELSKYNPENEEIYQRNYEQYLQKLEQLSLDFESDLANLKGKKAICLNEALTYLAKEVGMEVTTIQTNHEESTLSADTLKNLITQMKEKNIQIILVDKNDNLENAQTLEEETGAKIYQLDSAMNSKDDNTQPSKEDYYQSMVNNLEVFKQM